jgi:hypothetical protein
MEILPRMLFTTCNEHGDRRLAALSQVPVDICLTSV